jgi:hypothetical protein
MGKPSKDLPQAIPAEQLQVILGPSAEFCSWDAANPRAREFLAGWPFLFSHPLMGADNRSISAAR